MAVYTRVRSLLKWLMLAMARFPREHGHTVNRHMADLAMRVHDQLVAARHHRGTARAATWRDANMALYQLRLYDRLAWAGHW